ncbi:MAG: 5'/3'-nucleotidase SurE [Paracoccaceae bacterium]
MRILLTNDDGIDAPGLAALRDIAAELSDDVWTVAPATEQSGVGHCISYVRPVRVVTRPDRTWAVEGTPADCVLSALSLLPGRPDLILSGVNSGNNAAENTLYSGTVGAAMEGALQDVPSIALSQFHGPANRGLPDMFEAARAWGARAVRACLSAGFGGAPYPTFYNVNLPPVPAADVRGLRACAQGRRPISRYRAVPQTAPTGRDYAWIAGGDQQERSEEGSDAAANLDGYVALTPMRADLTHHGALDALARACG